MSLPFFVTLSVLFNLTISVNAADLPARVVFELEPDYLTASGMPSDAWTGRLIPPRDAGGEPPVIKPLRLPAKVQQHEALRRVFKLELPPDADVAQWMNRLAAVPGVVWHEPSPVRRTSGYFPKGTDGSDGVPSDPYYTYQWYLNQIYAPAAWDVSKGDSTVTIAVVDVGVDIDHGDLLRKRWINYAEAFGREGIDDDGNGFPDDVNGWDFLDDDYDPRPNPGDIHGTHVSGIAAAASDNGFGIAGIGWNCRIMAIRAGFGNSITDGYEGIIYAAAAGADVINLSWGSGSPSNIELITTEYAATEGALVVAAAGNLTGSPVSFLHYPAAYSGVLAVSAVDSNDFRASFSNFGAWVDVAAPGSRIFSIFPAGGFGVASGTSMATPMVAGAAALLKSQHPDWSAASLLLQIRASSDPIDALNNEFAGELGSGRLNLYRMLTDTKSGFEITNFEIDDDAEGDGDGMIDPGERLRIVVGIANRLPLTTAPTVKLESSSGLIQITPMEWNPGALAKDVAATNNADPFPVRVSPDAYNNTKITVNVAITAEGMAKQSFPMTLHVRQPYDEHDNGRVVMTVTNFGSLGYYDYERGAGEGVGQGFRYPEDGITTLFHGSLMVGAPPDRVSDNAYGDSTRRRVDFVTNSTGFAVITGEDGVQTGSAEFEDRYAERPLNVRVKQRSYSYPHPPNDRFVILDYTIINDGNQRIDSLRAALYLDWDIIEASSNICLWDWEREVGWMQLSRPGKPLYGAALIGREAGFYVAIDNRAEFRFNSWHDRRKNELFASDFSHALGNDPADWSQLLGTPALALPAGDSAVVTFAVVAGDDLEALFQGVAAARALWMDSPVGERPVIGYPARFEIVSTFPAPFNGWVSVVCRTDRAGMVTWTVHDLLGRVVVSSMVRPVSSGAFTVNVNAADLPSGSYIVRVDMDGKPASIPIELVR